MEAVQDGVAILVAPYVPVSPMVLAIELCSDIGDQGVGQETSSTAISTSFCHHDKSSKLDQTGLEKCETAPLSADVFLGRG